MIDIKARIGHKENSKDTWVENLPVRSLEYAEEDVKEIVKNFNNTLREGEKRRVFIKIESDEIIGEIHDWDKKTLMGVTDHDGRIVNVYQCKTCKLAEKVGGLDHPGNNKRYCYPKRVCVKCNKLFKTDKGRERHNCKEDGEYLSETIGKKISKMALQRLKGSDFK